MAQNFTPIDDLIKKHLEKKEVFSHPKEAEPVVNKSEPLTLQEKVEHEPQEKEVEKYVHLRPETIELPPDLKKIGVQSISTNQFPTYQNVKLPISDDKVITGLHAPITSSLRWLATLAVYILKLAHLKLRIVHGKVVRAVLH